MSPGVLRCPITDPIAMLQYCELEKLFLRTLSELVPETDFGRLPFWRYPDGTEIPYTGSGFPQLSLDEVTLLKVVIYYHPVSLFRILHTNFQN